MHPQFSDAKLGNDHHFLVSLIKVNLVTLMNVGQMHTPAQASLSSTSLLGSWRKDVENQCLDLEYGTNRQMLTKTNYKTNKMLHLAICSPTCIFPQTDAETDTLNIHTFHNIIFTHACTKSKNIVQYGKWVVFQTTHTHTSISCFSVSFKLYLSLLLILVVFCCRHQ